MKKILLSSIILVVFFYVIFFFGAVFKQFGMLEDAGEISGMMLPNQVVVDKDILSEKIVDVLNQDPIVLPAWDPMGALAQ